MKRVECFECRGTGFCRDDNYKEFLCPVCEGDGEVLIEDDEDKSSDEYSYRNEFGGWFVGDDED